MKASSNPRRRITKAVVSVSVRCSNAQRRRAQEAPRVAVAAIAASPRRGPVAPRLPLGDVPARTSLAHMCTAPRSRLMERDSRREVPSKLRPMRPRIVAPLRPNWPTSSSCAMPAPDQAPRIGRRRRAFGPYKRATLWRDRDPRRGTRAVLTSIRSWSPSAMRTRRNGVTSGSSSSARRGGPIVPFRPAGSGIGRCWRSRDLLIRAFSSTGVAASPVL